MFETWKDVIGYEGLYQVSNLGRIRCYLQTHRNVTQNEDGIRSLNYANKDYARVTLSAGHRQFKTHLVHRVVVEAFIGNIPNGMDVNHKDGDKLNNHVDNLEIVTKCRNSQHAVENGMLKVIGCDNPMAKLNELKVIEIKQRILNGERNVDIAKVYCVSSSLISMIRQDRIWKHL